MPNNGRTGAPYTPQPDVPPELAPRVGTVLAVLRGDKTVSQGARELGLSRVQMQTLKNRGLEGMLEALKPRLPGPPPRTPRERALSEENDRLRRRLAQTEATLSTYERCLEVATELLHSPEPHERPRPRNKRARGRQSSPSTTTSTPEPDPSTSLRRDAAPDILRMRATGVKLLVTSRLLGTSPATARRRLRADRRRLERRLTRRRRLDPSIEKCVAELVRDTRGLIGAEALRRLVTGVSRRQAADLKARVLTELERDRKRACRRLRVTAPGILRGFDAMHVATGDGRRYLLAAADGAVPFRTSLELAERYDGPTVADVLDRDLARHGPPLVLRMDRASVHRTPEVRDLLDRHKVLLLHGPPRHPRYYGQLERQNREHRSWLDALRDAPPDVVAAELPALLHVVNDVWPRPGLGYRTAGALWTARPPLRHDRAELRAEVDHLAARLLTHLDSRGAAAADLAWRLAIERTLHNHGYLEHRTSATC